MGYGAILEWVIQRQKYELQKDTKAKSYLLC
jgi:hypothetical protein